MNRSHILQRVLDPQAFPFWVPVITHYQPDGSIDGERMRRHAAQIAPHTRLWMVAGTTGDGWNLTGAQFVQMVDYACGLDFGEPRPNLLVGVLRPDTEQVLERIQLLKQRAGIAPGASLEDSLAILAGLGISGVTICAPVGEAVTQAEIEAHIGRVCEEARLPVVVYQLPQVTRNFIAPETLRRLADRYPEIVMFKDSGGGDEIARSGQMDSSLVLVRGAEGNYLEVLKSRGGWYDGWLLSTGNAFASQLAEIVAHLRQGEMEAATDCSGRLTALVEQVFTLARALPSGNAFSNSNRGADHILAYGKRWRQASLPLLQDGSRLPVSFLVQVAEALGSAGLIPEVGYMEAPGA